MPKNTNTLSRERNREIAQRALKDFLETWEALEPDPPSFERTWWLPVIKECEEVFDYLCKENDDDV